MGAGESVDLSTRPVVTVGGVTVTVERLLGEGMRVCPCAVVAVGASL
jgi:hypothetical protein